MSLHVGPKILAKIKIYVLTRAELLFHLCYEIPCNSKYDKRLFTELRVQYMKTTSSEHDVHTNWILCWHSEQIMYTTCSELVDFMYWTRNSVNNLLSYCGLIDRRISASYKDLPVNKKIKEISCKNTGL